MQAVWTSSHVALWVLPVGIGFAALLGWSARDLLERRRRDAAMQRGSERGNDPVMSELDIHDRLDVFDHVVDSAGIGFYHWDIASDRILWSRHHRALFGAGPDEPIKYENFRARLHPDDAAGVNAAITTAMRDRRDYLCDYRVCLPDGALRHIRGSGRITFSEAGEAVCMSGAVIDVSEVTAAGLEVARRERELEAIIGNLPDVVSRFDTERRHLFVSPCIEEITGLPPAAFIGKTNEELGMDPVLCARWRALLEDVIRHGIVREFEFSFPAPDGTEQFFVTRAIPDFDADGKVQAVMTIATDHTAREQAARKLRASEALLQQADTRKNEYLATLAHELRGPLAPIATAVQLMKLSERPETWRKSQEVIERQVAQLVELVDDLMEVGRISSGKLALRLARVMLQSAIENAIESVRPLFDANAQVLSVSMPEAPVWLEADATRLTQIFTNLLTNASKYSPAGTRVSVLTSIEEEQESRSQGGAGFARVVVSDNGIGLTPQAMDMIFDMFSQVHAQGVQARGGLGIGLALVRQLVHLHQGSISVASDGIGKGAQFTVCLPLAAAPQAPQLRQPASAAAPEGPRPPPAQRVLVVDDNVDGAQTLVALLGALGHTAECVHNGQDALAAAETGRYELVLLDLGLPDISGIQVALHLRGKPWGRHLPIVALTGLGQRQDRDLTRLAGFNLHLVKPVRIEDLLSLLGDTAPARSAPEPEPG